MRVKRIIAGIVIGGAIGTALEGLNIFFEFFMWSFPVFLPSLTILGGCIGVLGKAPEGAGSHRTPQDIEHLPACGVDFLTQLAKKMRYRQKVREQVQSELVTHFEDDLKDCLTEAQREQKAEKLIADFGDPTTLAVLMRRAKKRCRPFWRKALVRTFQAACVLAVCFVFYVIWFATGEPTISVDYVALLNRISKPEVRSDDNAWPHYEKAIGLYVPQMPVTKELISYRRNSKRREKAMQLKALLNDHRQKILEWLGGNRKHWDNRLGGRTGCAQDPQVDRGLRPRGAKSGSGLVPVLRQHAQGPGAARRHGVRGVPGASREHLSRPARSRRHHRPHP